MAETASLQQQRRQPNGRPGVERLFVPGLPSYAKKHIPSSGGGGMFFLRSEKRDWSSVGRGGGFLERGRVEKKMWDSDDETVDEFGRKKKRKRTECESKACSSEACSPDCAVLPDVTDSCVSAANATVGMALDGSIRAETLGESGALSGPGFATSNPTVWKSPFDVPIFNDEAVQMENSSWLGWAASGPSSVCRPGENSPSVLGHICAQQVIFSADTSMYLLPVMDREVLSYNRPIPHGCLKTGGSFRHAFEPSAAAFESCGGPRMHKQACCSCGCWCGSTPAGSWGACSWQHAE